MAKKSKKYRFTRKSALLSALAVLVIIGAGVGWHYHNRPSQAVIPSTASKSTNTLQNSPDSKTATPAAAASDKQATSSGTPGPTSTSGPPPQTPAGQFVSSHHPDKDGGEQSVCNTTPGATCYIKFVMGDTVRTLQVQTTDSTGATYWKWNSNSIPSGSWQVSAVAGLNGQTSTASDIIGELVIQ